MDLSEVEARLQALSGGWVDIRVSQPQNEEVVFIALQHMYLASVSNLPVPGLGTTLYLELRDGDYPKGNLGIPAKEFVRAEEWVGAQSGAPRITIGLESVTISVSAG